MTKGDFAQMHKAGDPLVLFNVWDAGSARAVAEAGAKAIGTGSHSVAGSQGYEDGEHIPFRRLVETAQQISDSVELPITVDVEAGYATNLADLSDNADALAHAGVIGCNLEDRLIRAGGLRSIDEQSERIEVFDRAGLFVNARTDVFLGPLMEGQDPNQTELVYAAIERAKAYARAGAGSFFIPGLSDPDLIAQVCDKVTLPVNVMRLPQMVSNAELAQLGVARISYGGAPWHSAMAGVTEAAKAAISG
ncbi:isocitrate lyase/phosphoenolpyruvate mutase family protein [uncultured Erythrobacter sp.]|uniref:isocitrate lyase/PEP mutase family protein n=1 Tax=uncultured Erythrobacter sp. TaxID=263913 RepID=UPI00262B14F5|nr:isocitrate lyase/phosphoenolpyruvate mutase family protein [uncultured Erythrobacter sp.]